MAPALVLLMAPSMAPGGAEAAMRVSIAVEATTPPLSGRSRLVCQVLPPSSESSTPDGAVMMMSNVEVGATDRVTPGSDPRCRLGWHQGEWAAGESAR